MNFSIRTAIGSLSVRSGTRKESKSLITRLNEGAEWRFDGAFFTALGVVLMVRTLTYVDTVAAVKVGLGVELNPLARLDAIFVAGSDVVLTMTVILLAILIGRREIRVVCYSFIIALVSADLTWDMVQYLELPPVNMTISQVYAIVWGVTAIIPLTVGVWQIEEMARRARGERPLDGATLEDLEPRM